MRASSQSRFYGIMLGWVPNDYSLEVAADAPFDEILDDYPPLEIEDIRAAVQYAAKQTDHLVLTTK